jgi:predicted PurR-regulated permease PerM
MEKYTTIRVSSETIIKVILYILFFVLLYYVRDVILIILTSVVLASAVEPATKWFEKRNISRLIGVILIYVGGALIVSGVFYLLVPSLLVDANNLLSKLPEYLSHVPFWNVTPEAVNTVSQSSAVQTIQALPAGFSFGEVVSSIQNAISTANQGLLNTASGIFGGLLGFILIMVLSFYLAVQEDGVEDFLKVIVPVRSQKYVLDLWKRSQIKIGLWMQGQVLLGLLISVLVYLGLTIFKVKNALLLAILAGVFELIPVFGPILSAIPAIIAAIFDGGGLTKGLLVAGLYLIIQQFENHLIYPLVVRKIVGVSPIVVILAFIIGGKLAGFLGILLSVPISSALMELYSDVQREKMSARERLEAEGAN